MIEITENKIDIQGIVSDVIHPEAGGIDVFIGTTRNNTSDKKVVRLEFESHVTMAKKELQKIIDHARSSWDVKKVSVSHRVGVVEIGDVAVAIAVACPHRKDAFEACRYIIDTLKETVPIWKKEVFEDGSVWVASHP